mmetsp:Transcript_41574/g.120480  ORF Transcript_41574/g.120480 Transcript_41574/m.120480 type:complete len:261 (-) Transcript_41574:4-786(-)
MAKDSVVQPVDLSPHFIRRRPRQRGQRLPWRSADWQRPASDNGRGRPVRSGGSSDAPRGRRRCGRRRRRDHTFALRGHLQVPARILDVASFFFDLLQQFRSSCGAHADYGGNGLPVDRARGKHSRVQPCCSLGDDLGVSTAADNCPGRVHCCRGPDHPRCSLAFAPNRRMEVAAWVSHLRGFLLKLLENLHRARPAQSSHGRYGFFIDRVGGEHLIAEPLCSPLYFDQVAHGGPPDRGHKHPEPQRGRRAGRADTTPCTT